MTRAKNESRLDGVAFLRKALIGVERNFQAELVAHRESITHPTALGDASEDNWIALLERYLPRRYRVAKAFAVDHLGHTTDQLDSLIFDAHFTPALFGKDNHLYVPAEAVYATFEIKQTVSPKHLKAAAAKAKSIRALTRTSAPIPWIAGQNPPKPPFSIMAGLLAYEAPWKEGLKSKSFKRNFHGMMGASELDFVLTAKNGFYDIFNAGRAPTTADGQGAMIRGLFRLLTALREKATVVAIEWSKYERALELPSPRPRGK